MVEILSPCPVDWGMKPVASLEWIRNEMVKTFPLGTFKDGFAENT
jgi:2-oxoglutarate ferredoxin oxidoreductase subunit beta